MPLCMVLGHLMSKNREVGEMECRPCSTLTAGCLSAAAQRVMTALRAQYAGRISRRAQTVDFLSTVPRLSQNQGTFNKTAVPHTQTNILYKGRERQLLEHSPFTEKFLCHPDLRQLHNQDNTFNQCRADNRGNWRQRDCGDDVSLSGFNSGNNIQGLSRSPPELDLQGEELFQRNGFVRRGSPQAVMELPETCSEIFNRSKRIQLLACNEEDCKVEAITHTPAVKRQRFANVQIPIITCLKQFEEDYSGQKNEDVRTYKNLDTVQFCCFEEKTKITEEVDLNSYAETSEKLKFNSVLFEGVFKESGDKVCETGQKEIEEYSRSNLKESSTSRKESQKTSLLLDDSCHDSDTNKIPTNEGDLFVHHNLVSLSDRVQYTKDRENEAAVETGPAETKHVCHDAGVHQSDMKTNQMETQKCSLEPGHIAATKATETHQDKQIFLQKCPPAVCGVLVLLKKSLDSLVLEETRAAEERLLFLKLDQRPAWAQQNPQHNQDLFTRELMLKMVCGTQILVCYKSKDLLRTVLRHFSKDLSWKQVTGCQVLDPQIAAWLLDPADSAPCFQNLFNKYCTRPTTNTPAQTEPRHKTVSHVIFSLSRLHRVMVELRNKLETQGLWQLYFCVEQKMIPVLAAMESHRIHVDRNALKKTSEMLGTKMKQLEQEAHQSAGQKFLVSSSSQLRLVLFEKLRLHERCENKKLPKTMLKQQQSTSEAVLLKLQDLHPLPRIVLEYRQVHKIKSTFLDGILSCMTKTFISSTWNQTSTVSGRLSAKHPNFQALPRQPVRISKRQCVEAATGKEAELVTVHPRTMFIPREGWTFLSADFCQVELRLLAHLSSDPELLRIFQNPEADVFNMLASQWKGISEDSVSAEDREHAKRIVYSVVYGAGKERLSGILGVNAEEASHFQESFLQKYKQVQAFIQCTVQHCHKYGYVKSIMGRRRFLPHIHSTDWSIRNQAERQAVNFVVQGSAADLCKMAMIHICSLVASSTTLTARLLAQIHDELLFEVEDSQMEDFAVLVKETMESLQHISCLGVSLSVPLKVSVSTGRSWGSMCEVNFAHAATSHTSI
ncbi:DNA polymerase nu isoform X4 [Silurus meridionalis]|uniref:DNA polymerase nu isoform X4 n=1 Tax=Silurus meridionalis TaxID=175797 RepID=UPI001EEA9D3B|nr:DNA polymerase nu isoform X4 [Silurus meridionalis]